MIAEFERLRIGYQKSKQVKCPTCSTTVRNDNLANHMKTSKCACKGQYQTRAEHGKARVRCPKCNTEVCKNKLKRHQRTSKCLRTSYSFHD